MKHYLVASPEVGVVIPVLDYGEGPMEYGCDVVCVDAENKKEAVTLGVKKMLDEGMKYVSDQRGDGASPFVGVRAELATCPHGVTCCDCPPHRDAECEACAREDRERGKA